GQAGHVEPGLVVGGQDRDGARDDPDPERGHPVEVERGRGVDRPVLHRACPSCPGSSTRYIASVESPNMCRDQSRPAGGPAAYPGGSPQPGNGRSGGNWAGTPAHLAVPGGLVVVVVEAG